MTTSDRGHLLYVWSPAGYRLQERDGAPPAVGEVVDLGELGRQAVQKVGVSPLPGDGRPCAFLTAEP